MKKQNAMTLTELLIASALVGIVTLGLVSAEYAIRMSRQSASKDGVVTSQLQAAMIRMTQDANGTVGNAADTGIVEFGNTSTTGDKTVCFRQAAGDPNLYTDDTWNCWWYKETGGSDNKDLSSCSGLTTTPTASDACVGHSPITWAKLSDRNFYSLILDAQNKINYIQIALSSMADVSKDANAISNPFYTLNSKVNPPGLSR